MDKESFPNDCQKPAVLTASAEGVDCADGVIASEGVDLVTNTADDPADNPVFVSRISDPVRAAAMLILAAFCLTLVRQSKLWIGLLMEAIFRKWLPVRSRNTAEERILLTFCMQCLK